MPGRTRCWPTTDPAYIAHHDACWVVSPRHGSQFDVATGVPRSLAATEPVPTYPARIGAGTVVVDLPD